MPQPTPAKTSDRKPLTVEELLRLKRAEQPPQQFWESFDRQMQQRMLQALVTNKKSAPQRAWLAMGAMRHALVPGLAAAMVAVGVTMQSQAPTLTAHASRPAAALAPTAEPMAMIVQVDAPAARGFVAPAVASGNQHFVVDSLRLDSQASGYRKVMAGESLTAGQQASTRYVADQLGGAASRFLVATTSY